MTKLMLDGGRDENEDKENRKGNRRETWAPGLAGTVTEKPGTVLLLCTSIWAPFVCALPTGSDLAAWVSVSFCVQYFPVHVHSTPLCDMVVLAAT